MKPRSRRNQPCQIEALEDRRLLTVFAVTNTNDSGAGSLRWALTQSNNTPGVDTIAFNITTSNKTIRPTSPLPLVYDPAIVNGETEPGYAGKPLVRIDGALAGATDGLKLFGNDTLEGLDITGFNGQAVTTIPIANSGFGGNVIRANWIGVDLSGAVAPNNSHDVGIYSPGNTVDRNVLGSSTTGNGIWCMALFGGVNGNNTISNNYIGLDPTGTQPRGVIDGIGIQNSPNDVIVNNIIANCRDDGILLQGAASHAIIQGNFIGTDKSGAVAMGNGLYGVEDQSDHATIGGLVASQRNVIAANKKAGIVLWLGGAHDNVVEGNYIGTDASGTKALGNGEQGIAFSQAGANTVGGATPAAANVICANKGEGVGIFPGSGEIIEGNRIGVDAAGHALGNGTWGVTVIAGSSNCLVKNNVIANNPNSAVFANAGEAIVTGNTASVPTSNAPAVINFSASSVTVNEAAGTISLKIIRLGDPTGVATIHFTTANRTALAGVDYTPVSGILTFKAGQTSKVITIPILHNAASFADTSFVVGLSSPTGATQGMPSLVRVTIQNVDVRRRRRRA